MNNWIEDAAEEFRKKEEKKRERELIEHTLYVRRRALAPYFWREMREAMNANIAGLNKLRPNSLWLAEEEGIVKVESGAACVEIDFSEIVPIIEVAVWRRPASHSAGSVPVRKRLKFNLAESDLYLRGEDGSYGAESAAEYVLDLALYGEVQTRNRAVL